MIKKEHIKKTLWGIVILTNVVFWVNVYLDVKIKAQRLVYQVNQLMILDGRINKEKNKYLYADNEITFINLLTRKKISTIYSKPYSKVKPFKRFYCTSGENALEYSRQDDNYYYPEDATSVYTTSIDIPLMNIIKTYFTDNEQFVLNTRINDLPLPLNVRFFKYNHNCGVFADWNIKI